MGEGVEGLLRDKTRPSGTPPVPDETVKEVVRLTHEAPPHEATHWTAQAMAKTVGLAVSTIQTIWKAHGLAPHRWRTFKLSNDPAFVEKLRDVVGLYVDPPAHAVVLSVDEKSQIQALDRTQPGLPMKTGRGATMTHDYKRHGTTTLFAALNILDGTVIGRNMQRHRHQEFIRFLKELERQVPAGKTVHAIVDNYAAHKHPKVREWLARHPRWTFHFTPTSSSWLNAVEGFFAKLSRRRLRRGVFRSLAELQNAINRFLAEYNANNPKAEELREVGAFAPAGDGRTDEPADVEDQCHLNGGHRGEGKEPDDRRPELLGRLVCGPLSSRSAWEAEGDPGRALGAAGSALGGSGALEQPYICQ